MRPFALALGLLLLICAPASAAATPDYFTVPTGYSVSNFGVTADEDGNIWFGAQSPSNGQQPVPSLARLVPSQAVPGTSSGLTFYPTPDPPNVNCCANQLRSVAYNKIDHKLYYSRSDGGIGAAIPSAMVPGTSTGITGVGLPGLQDLWDIAPGSTGGVWFTEKSASNVGPTYYGNRIGFFNGTYTEGPNIAIQNGQSGLNSLRYDAKPSGIAVDGNGTPWFAEEDPGNPGYRIGSYAGQGDSYSEYLVAPCEGTSPCSGSYTGTGLSDVAVGADGGIWFTNVLNRKFGRFDPASHTMVQYTMASIGLGAASPRQIIAAPDGTLWMTSMQGYTNATANALVQITPAATPAATPTAVVYRTSTTAPPLGLAADNAGNIWFSLATPGPPSIIGRLAGVVGGAAPPAGAPAPTPAATPAPTPTSTPAPTAPTAIALVPASVGRATLTPPQTGNGEINANQVCAGPPEARCSIVYLIKEHEYVTGFPGTTARAATAKKKAKHKLRVLGTKTVTLHGGQKAKVSVKLNALGKRILKGKHKVKVDFTATQKLAGGKTKVLARKTLTIRKR